MKNFGFCLAGMTDRESENKNTKNFFVFAWNDRQGSEN
jgi:hypothetical protein